MKYEFKELSLDNYELHYVSKDGKKKVLSFKRTIELAQKLQSADANARLKMLDYLTKLGKTKNDLIIEKIENGKIIVDETNYREFEANFIQKEALELLVDIFKTLFNGTPDEIMLDMGVENHQEEALNFVEELRDLLINGKVKTPSIQEISE